GGGSGDTASHRPYPAMSTAARRKGACQPKPSHAAAMMTAGPARAPIAPIRFDAPSIRGKSSPLTSTNASSHASTIADAETPITNDAPKSTRYDFEVANAATAAANHSAPPAAITRLLT